MDLPRGWIGCSLSEIVQIINGDRGKNYPSKDKLSKTGIPFVSASNISNGMVVSDELLCMSDMQYRLLRNGKLEYGDIVFCIRGSLGKTGFFKFDKGAIASSLVIVRTIMPEPVMRKYIFRYLNSNLIYKEISKYDNGTAQPNLAARDFAKFCIPLPPLAEQHRIVAKIDALFSELDKGVEMLQTIRQQLRLYRQAVLKWAFEGKPMSMKPLSAFVETIFDGPFGSNLKTADYTDSGVRVVRLENIKQMHFLDEKKSFVSEEKYQTLQRNTVRYPDLMVATFVIGQIRACIVPMKIDKAINKADCVCIRTSNALDSKLLMYYLSTKEVYSKYFTQIHGDRPRINTTQIKQILVPVLPKDEKNAIVAAIESRLSVCDKLEQIVDESLAKAAALRQSILKKAFAGQLVPQDPNDEPAEKLLERIRAEQKHAAKSKTKGGKKNG